ncbi:hypothetical protein OJAV_G00036760 [Oryzias javanicus]|uniref:Uncharacterized protein n=1 Tax=Oryzias javanicus TaxID=123683 RepID=A0A3S2N5L1_ORYJA|nr:hypothetical protein OJAV_G00036760 [Oryzias javanicus]
MTVNEAREEGAAFSSSAAPRGSAAANQRSVRRFGSSSPHRCGRNAALHDITSTGDTPLTIAHPHGKIKLDYSPFLSIRSRLQPRTSSCREISAVMTQSSADPEGGRSIHRSRRTSKLAVVVVLQNLLVAACLLTTFYLYYFREVPEESEKAVYIQFEGVTVLHRNGTVKFGDIHGYHMVKLEDKDKIHIKCAGPYIWHMDVCYESMPQEATGATGATGILQLEVKRSETPASSFTLNATTHPLCRGLQSVVYLREKEEASVRLWCSGPFRIINMTMGLHYLLRERDMVC